MYASDTIKIITMSHESEIADVSDREDNFDAVDLYIFKDAPLPLEEHQYTRLITAVSGERLIYIRHGENLVIERFDEMIANTEQPYKTILETIIDLNINQTVYDYMALHIV